MPKKSTVSQLEKEKAVVIEAMKVWPEKRDEYIEYLVHLNGRIGRTKRAAKIYKAKAVQQSCAMRSEIERGYRQAMEKG